MGAGFLEAPALGAASSGCAMAMSLSQPSSGSNTNVGNPWGSAPR